MNYVVNIKELSSGTIERTITPYDDEDVALRKFHEAFNTIKGGPKRITSILLKDVEGQVINTVVQKPVVDESDVIKTFNTIVVKNETWILKETTPEEEPEE